jgi:sn-glycerol 3-phosphate transport system permease protein
MIAVANIWLFFYTPTYGLLEQVSGASSGCRRATGWATRRTALAAITVVAVWKEAGFFMIFYLAALQGINPSLREAAAIEGASRWFFFRRVLWPLLMPTTLFVGVNAVINAFRMVDHVFVMTRGGPDNATALLLYHLYEVGFKFWDPGYARPSRWCCWRCWPRWRCCSSSCSTAAPTTSEHAHPGLLNEPTWLDTLAAWLLALLWFAPLAYAIWTAFHPTEYSTRFTLTAPLTLDNFRNAWAAAPFARYFANTAVLVVMILAAQLVLCTLAAYAFARFEFPGKHVLFALVLVQLMVMPDILLVENYRTHVAPGPDRHAAGHRAAVLRVGLRHLPAAPDLPGRAQGTGRGRARGRRQRAADAVARVRAAGRPVYVAFALVSVSYHWNNFLWPLVVTNSVESRPLTVGLQVFASTDQGIDWSIITAATLMTSAPLLVGFLLFQRQFVQSFMRAGIK